MSGWWKGGIKVVIVGGLGIGCQYVWNVVVIIGGFCLCFVIIIGIGVGNWFYR